jgi:hypothetical protein
MRKLIQTLLYWPLLLCVRILVWLYARMSGLGKKTNGHQNN